MNTNTCLQIILDTNICLEYDYSCKIKGEIKNSPSDVAATTYVTQTALHKAYSHT